jgi:hypothetical protein
MNEMIHKIIAKIEIGITKINKTKGVPMSSHPI